MRRKTEESSFGQLVKTNGVGGQCVHKDQVLILMIENSSTGHLLYTNRWNLHKAPRDWKEGEPLSPFTQVGIYFTTSIEPALSGWWRARGRAQFSDENNFRAETARDSQKVWRRGCHSYWGATLSDLATGRILSRALSFVVVIYVTHRPQPLTNKGKKPKRQTKLDFIIKCEKHFWCNSWWCKHSSHVVDFNGGWIMNVVLNCLGQIME